MSADVLRRAAQVLEESLGTLREAWVVDRDNSHVYVTHAEEDERGNWVAYTGDEAGATRYARWMATMDPLTGRLLVDVLEGCVLVAEQGREPEPEWVAFAEALVAKAESL